jgi:hypothetical protein
VVHTCVRGETRGCGRGGTGAPAGTRDRNLGSRLRPRPARGPRRRAERRRRRLCRRLRDSRGAPSLSTAPPRPCHKPVHAHHSCLPGVLLSTPAPGVSVTQRQELSKPTPHNCQLSDATMAAQERKRPPCGRAFPR